MDRNWNRLSWAVAAAAGALGFAMGWMGSEYRSNQDENALVMSASLAVAGWFIVRGIVWFKRPVDK